MKPVVIWKFSNPIEAHMAVNALETKGIPAILSGGNPGTTFIGLELSWSPRPTLISLSVPKAKSNEAISILERIFGQHGEEEYV